MKWEIKGKEKNMVSKVYLKVCLYKVSYQIFRYKIDEYKLYSNMKKEEKIRETVDEKSCKTSAVLKKKNIA